MLVHWHRKNDQERMPKCQAKEEWKGGRQSDKRECTVECCRFLEDVLGRADRPPGDTGRGGRLRLVESAESVRRIDFFIINK